MEVGGMEAVTSAKIHLASAVEGGDSCSICLEPFCQSDPSTVTSCKHEFHLQCVLEWCQRSSNCPMCWQAISLKDPSSQELLEAVESERIRRSKPARNVALYHHPALTDLELHHLPVGVDAAELQDQIMQHFVTATAMGRTRHIVQRESLRSSSAQNQTHPQLVFFSTNSSDSSATPASISEFELASTPMNPSRVRVNHISSSSSPIAATTRQGIANISRSRGHEPFDSPGPSEFQSVSGNWKARFNSMSMKYKESISRSTKELKEKLFSRSSSVSEIRSEVLREVNAGVASVSRLIERLDSRPTGHDNTL